MGIDIDTSGMGNPTAHPGPIDNSPLFKETGEGEIRDGLIDELEYVLLPAEGWNAVVDHFGLTADQAPISRKVILIVAPNSNRIKNFTFCVKF